MRHGPSGFWILIAAAGWLSACADDDPGVPGQHGQHGSIADHIMAPLGEPVPFASPEQRRTFTRGKAVAEHRFTRAEGLGPSFNVTFCAACHSRPATGGTAGNYRTFALAGVTLDGRYFPADDDLFPDHNALSDGVVRLYHYPEDEFYYGGHDFMKPALPDDLDAITHRNPVPLFGLGLLAEISEEEILSRADPNDERGDGIRGRPNYEGGVLARFGRKAQTASIVGFIRGPLFNHMGITTDPLTEEELAALPVDSSGGPSDSDVDMTPCEERDSSRGASLLIPELLRRAQAAPPAGPLCDDDDIPDPEMPNRDLFDLVSFAMLLAPPPFEELGEEGLRGQTLFDEIGCDSCHTPRLQGPRGPVPAYTDLLIHDMGPELADGVEQGDASGSEFRTQPLWGVAAAWPYLHDGRAHTLEEAILWHGGSAQPSRDRFAELPGADQDAVVEFLLSLGGREHYATRGSLAPDEPMPAAGAYGGPYRDLDSEEEERFLRGRALFDREFGYSDGVGKPEFNGDSCRACHFQPVIGGSGPRGLNVIRHGILDEHGQFAAPSTGTILHRVTTVLDALVQPESAANIFELRQTPHLFGVGLIDRIPEDQILARADPDQVDLPDDIQGRPSYTEDGRLGRFGWKAQVPSVAEFTRDAASAELGMTVAPREGFTFGELDDETPVPSPQMTEDTEELLTEFMALLAPPPRQPTPFPALAARGEELFEEIGCAACHVPQLETDDGTPVPLYSDLLLHEILSEDAVGIEDSTATMREFRTAPLWGLSQTAPYMHSGQADTIKEAILLHDGTASGVRERFRDLTEEEREALLIFLRTL